MCRSSVPSPGSRAWSSLPIISRASSPKAPEDEWALKECFTCKLPMQKVEDLAAYVDYPICKMLITLDPARRGEVLEAGRKQFAGEIDLYPSSPFFIEAVPLGVAKDVSLGSLLESRV